MLKLAALFALLFLFIGRATGICFSDQNIFGLLKKGQIEEVRKSYFGFIPSASFRLACLNYLSLDALVRKPLSRTSIRAFILRNCCCLI